MTTHRVYARPSRIRRKSRNTNKKGKAHSWIQKQRRKDASWTSFKFDMQRARMCYNLREEICADIFREFRQGRPGENDVNLVPKDPNNIRQDVLATFLLFKYNLSLEEFILAKRLATVRNRGRSRPDSEVENMKWPARPDIFAHCPPAVPNAISDDELAEYFLTEKYNVTTGSGSDGSESENADSLYESERADTEGGTSIANQTADENESEVHDSTVLAGTFQSVERPRSNATVDLLRHAYQTFDSWPSAEWMKSFYGVKHTKVCQVRSAITALKEGRVEGVTDHDFEMTFHCEELMKVKLQTNKKRSIQQVVALYRSNYSV